MGEEGKIILRSKVIPMLFLSIAVSIVVAVALSAPFSMLLAAASSAYLFIIAIHRPRSWSISFSRSFSPVRVYEGGEVDVTLLFENLGDRVGVVEVVERIPEGLELVEGSDHFVLTLNRGEAARVTYRVRCPESGRYFFDMARARLRDPFGVYVMDLELSYPTYVVALPRAEEVRKVYWIPKPRSLQVGIAKSATSGMGAEFYSLREYMPGDDFRRINWKAIARNVKLLSNEYEWERMIDGYIVIDGRHRSAHVIKAIKFIAASLVTNLLSWRNKLGLISFGYVIHTVQPDSGKKHLLRLLEAIVDISPSRPEVFDYQAEAAYRLIARHPHAVVITPLVDGQITSFIARLKRARIEPVVIAPTLELERAWEPSLEGMSQALLDIGRENSVRELSSIGVDVIEWKVGDPFLYIVEALKPWVARR